MARVQAQIEATVRKSHMRGKQFEQDPMADIAILFCAAQSIAYGSLS